MISERGSDVVAKSLNAVFSTSSGAPDQQALKRDAEKEVSKAPNSCVDW
jgi:hypothetical protein